MTNRCITPGCTNQPRSIDARLCNTCKARNAAAKLEYNRERQRRKPKSNSICAHPGCNNVHHGRSCYCLKHVKQPRGANMTQPRCGTLRLARHLLHYADPPQRLRRLELVKRWNIVTGEVEERWE